MREKIDNIFKKININMLIYIVFSSISILYLLSKIIDRHYSLLKVSVVLFAFILFLVVSYFIYKRCDRKNTRLENIFLIFSILFGIIYIGGFPPSQLPDDRPDYLRSLEVSKLQLTTPQKEDKVGRKLSSNIEKVYESNNYKDVRKISDLKIKNNKKTFYSYPNKSLYAFTCYIPQAMGVGLGRILNLPILVQIILGKIFNYMLYVVLIYLSIKYIPIKKELVFFISLLPMSIQEATSLAPDSMIISTSIALISFILYQRENNKAKMNTKNMILLGMLSSFISLCKIIYLPLIFLMFLIPDNKFKSKKQKWIFCLAICLISIIFNLYWLSISSNYLKAFHRSNASLQLKYILSNPIKYGVILYKTIDYNILIYLKQMVGGSLGKFVVETSPIMILISIILLFLLMMGENRSGKTIFRVLEKLYISLILIVTILLMFTSLYLQWTAYKGSIIDGVQGRYFIPLLLIFALLFAKEQELVYGKKLICVTYFLDIISLISIIFTFM